MKNYLKCKRKGGRAMTLKCRKLLSVFLALLTVMSIFSINASAVFQGSDSTSAFYDGVFCTLLRKSNEKNPLLQR